MARSPIVDPRTSEARSSWLAGLTEVCNKITGILDMKTDTFTNIPMPELYISENDRFRIYQVENGSRCWMQTPPPVIKKNGSVITELNDGFEIDYLGGSIAFEDEYRLTADDTLTVSATYIVSGSNQIASILSQLEELADATAVSKNYKGYYATLAELQNTVATGEEGDYAIVEATNSIYIWNSENGAWVDTYKAPDLSAYYTSDQVDAELSKKEDNIAAHGETNADDAWYYGGRKLWVNLYSKVLETAIAGVVFTDGAAITESDTILSALGKLQAQITNNVHPIKGTGEPTSATTGIIGQDYINTSTGDKWHLTAINEDGTYQWEQYVDVSKLDDKVSGYLPLTGGELTGNLSFLKAKTKILAGKQSYICGTEGSYSTSHPSIIIGGSRQGGLAYMDGIVERAPFINLFPGEPTPAKESETAWLTGVATPRSTYPYDAVNKKYVDDIVGDIATILDSINGEEPAVLAEQIITDSWEESY